MTREPALDGLRGIAVLLVVATHGTLLFAPQLFKRVFAGGFLGVEIFFVLSGFLITSLLLNEQARSGSVALLAFYRRRAFRLLPALFAMLAVHFVYTLVAGLPIGVEISSIFAAAFYIANWVLMSGHRFAVGLQHVWSLSVEEQFYFVWPLVTVGLVGARRSIWTVSVGLCTAILVVVIWRAALWDDGTNFLRLGYIYPRTDTNADSLLVGALAAHLWTRGLVPQRRLVPLAWVGSAFVMSCAVLVPQWQGFYYKGGLTAVAIATAIVVVVVVDGESSLAHLLSTSVLRAVGRVSYGVYLWHVPIFVAVHRYGSEWPSLTQLGASLTLTATMTIASWRFVETPFLRLKDRPAR